MEKNTNYLRRYNNQIEEIEKLVGVNRDKIIEIIDDFFVDLKSKITDPRMPTVKITNLGTFKPSIGLLNWQIKSALRAYRGGKIERDRAVSKITHLWAIKQRLIKEKSGEETWSDWKDAEK